MKTILVLICLLLVAGVAFSGDESDNPVGTSQTTYQVKLTDGTILEVSSHQIQRGYIAFVLGNGSKVAFRRIDVDLSTLPSDSETNPKEISQPDSLGAHNLRDVGIDIPKSENTITIVGSGTLTELPSSTTYDELREKALAQIEAIAEQYSESAAELTKNVLDYQNGCSGYTVTYHEGTTSGVGLFAGTAEQTNDGSWGPTIGSSNWDVNSGNTTFTFQGLATWQEEHAWTSTAYNSDTPYCQALWSEILAQRGFVEPVLYSAVRDARLNYILDSEINTVFLSHGIGPVGFWVQDLR